MAALTVKFYEQVDDARLKFAVIIARHRGKWIFCKHKDRDTFEIPGGHREQGEDILTAARRELEEETGARHYSICPVCIYSVTGKTRLNESGDETFGMLYSADVTDFTGELHSEIESVHLFDTLPTAWTYPLIQPLLLEEYQRRSGR